MSSGYHKEFCFSKWQQGRGPEQVKMKSMKSRIPEEVGKWNRLRAFLTLVLCHNQAFNHHRAPFSHFLCSLFIPAPVRYQFYSLLVFQLLVRPFKDFGYNILVRFSCFHSHYCLDPPTDQNSTTRCKFLLTDVVTTTSLTKD